MSQYKDFQGKTLDDAISEACNYYGVEREKLEVEIVSDAKTGIFGLVGAKKAVIRAARVQPPDRAAQDDGPGRADRPADGPAGEGEAGDSGQRRRGAARDRAATGKGRPARDAQRGKAAQEDANRPAASGRTSPADADGPPSAAAGPSFAAAVSSGRSGGNREQSRKPHGNAAGGAANAGRAKGARPGGREADARSANTPDYVRPEGEAETAAPARGRHQRDNASRKGERGGRQNASHAAERPGEAAILPEDEFSADGSLESGRDEFSEFSLEGCDREALFAAVSDVIQHLVEPIVGPAHCAVDIHDNRVRASVDCGEASGLLVGREGHTLAAVQYLASRIIAKRIGGSIRLQIDAGSYRERQDDRLKALALALAERVKATRRPQSTRPLSAYQRRIVHLALEEDELVQTHSKGEGTQRRVIIQLKRAGRGKESGAPTLDENTGPAPAAGETDFSGPDGPAGGPEVEALRAGSGSLDAV